MTQQINLIDAGVLASRRRGTGALLLASVGVVALGVAAHYAVEKVRWDRVAAAAAAADASTTPIPAPDAIDTELAQAQARLATDEAMRQASSTLIDATQDTAPRLASLVAALPATSWLRQVEFVGARGIRVLGGSLNSSDLASYSTQLARQAAFAGLPIHALNVEQQVLSPVEANTETATTHVYQFELSSLAEGGDTR